MKRLTKIRANQSGWVVYFDNNPDMFVVFRSDEPERFVKYIAENVAGIKIDQLVKTRQAEVALAVERLDARQQP